MADTSIAALAAQLLVQPHRTCLGQGLSGRDKLIDQYEQERAEAASLLTALVAERGPEGWTWPKFKMDDLVEARLHNGSIREGRICYVETRYSFGPDGAPYHCYMFDWGKKHCQHLGEENIIRLLPAVTEVL